MNAASTVDIRPLRAEEFTACARLACRVFGPGEAIPDWMMFTTTRQGGLAFGAFKDDDLVGYCYGFPAFDGRPFLYSCGLAVLPQWRSLGIGRALKCFERDAAIRRGYREMRWTTDALASPSLYLYLTRLGAVVTAYHTDLYEPFRPGTHVDEVEISWALDRRPSAPARRSLAEIARAGGVIPCGGEHPIAADTTGPIAVEIPWNIALLRRQQPESVSRWMLTARRAMPALLRAGFQGVDVAVSSEPNRSFVIFERSAIPSAHA